MSIPIGKVYLSHDDKLLIKLNNQIDLTHFIDKEVVILEDLDLEHYFHRLLKTVKADTYIYARSRYKGLRNNNTTYLFWYPTIRNNTLNFAIKDDIVTENILNNFKTFVDTRFYNTVNIKATNEKEVDFIFAELKHHLENIYLTDLESRFTVLENTVKPEQ